MVIDYNVASLTWSYVPMLIFRPGHWCLCWYSHLFICSHVAIHMWSCFPCWYSHMVMLTCVSVHSWSCIHVLVFALGYVFAVLVFSLGHVSQCLYSYLVMYLHVDNHTWPCITILLFSLSHLLFSLSHVDIHTSFVFLCCYSYLFINPLVAIDT